MTVEEKGSVEAFVRGLFLAGHSSREVKDEIGRVLTKRNSHGIGVAGDNAPEAKQYALQYEKSLKTLGTSGLPEVVSKSVEKMYPPGLRALDAIARVLAQEFSEEVCVAVCVEPRYQRSLLVASNNKGLDSGSVEAKLRDFVASTPDTRSSYAEFMMQSDLPTLSGTRGTLTREEKARYLKLRLDSDVFKLQTALNNLLKSLRIVVVKSEEDSVHAELQLLDHVERHSFRYGGVSGTAELYVGVSLRCCGKCHTVFSAYNACGFNHVRVRFRGTHPTYDFGWVCPKSIKELVGSTNKGFPGLAESLTFATQAAQQAHQMTHDLSDDEDEYVDPRFRLT